MGRFRVLVFPRAQFIHEDEVDLTLRIEAKRATDFQSGLKTSPREVRLCFLSVHRASELNEPLNTPSVGTVERQSQDVPLDGALRG